MVRQSSRDSSFRVAVAVDLRWNFKRHTDVFAGVARYAEEHEDWRCIIDDFAADTLAEHPGRGSPYDGIIGRVTPKLATQARRRKLPLVNVWISSPVANLVSLLPDMGKAGELLAEHLLARGIRRFLCLLRRGDVGERNLGRRFRDVVTEAGSRCDVYYAAQRFAHSHAQSQKTRAAIEDWIDRTPMPVGVVTGVDIMARHVAQICRGLGLQVPQDVAIAGGANEPTVCLYPEPTLTSIEYGFDHVGYEAARAMHRMLLGHPFDQRALLMPPRALVVRHSSDFIYVNEEIVSAAMQFIAKNASRPIRVADIARAAGTSRRTLEQRFERHLHRSVGDEIRRVRIDHAKRLLVGSEQTVKQIAAIVGFGNSRYMARVFRREVGVSPREYRCQFVDGE